MENLSHKLGFDQVGDILGYLDECRSTGQTVLYSEALKRYPASIFIIPTLRQCAKSAQDHENEPHLVEEGKVISDWLDNFLIIDEESKVLEDRILKDPERAALDPKSILTD